MKIFNITDYEINLDDYNKYIYDISKELNILDSEFSIIITDNKYIRKLNREYRNIDKETDVISFALKDSKDIIDFDVLGDIYISYDKAVDQAREYNHSLKREILFLITHGILHLLGYDHLTKEDEEKMFKKQDELLDKYGVKR